MEDFEKKLESMGKPETKSVKPPIEIKLAIVNAERSAAIGVWLIVVHCFFLACVVMKYLFQINLGLLDTFEDMISAIDKNPATWWIQPVLLTGLPIVGIVLNTLAISYFNWDGSLKTVTIMIKI